MDNNDDQRNSLKLKFYLYYLSQCLNLIMPSLTNDPAQNN